ncbi:hypothetical protein MSSD14B_38310 [Marinobacter salsuginis]|uniref:Uncharacterized protein n=1 Tax=Marinobacter salsuginis TaxID=418719 RepID=A0A5M3Q4K4_9GAMM|nr:hypothetical protein MSSD14B_38310 [Marinobacter salsuginis]
MNTDYISTDTARQYQVEKTTDDIKNEQAEETYSKIQFPSEIMPFDRANKINKRYVQKRQQKPTGICAG